MSLKITLQVSQRWLTSVFPLEECGLSLASLLYQINSLFSLQETAAACCAAICKTVIEGEDEWKIGRSKIFLRVKTTYNSNHVLPQLFSIVLTQQHK